MKRTKRIRADHDSSNVEHTRFDPALQLLDVTFNNGSRYRYGGVPSVIYGQLLRAGSIGSFVARRIRWRFPYIKLRSARGQRRR